MSRLATKRQLADVTKQHSRLLKDLLNRIDHLTRLLNAHSTAMYVLKQKGLITDDDYQAAQKALMLARVGDDDRPDSNIVSLQPQQPRDDADPGGCQESGLLRGASSDPDPNGPTIPPGHEGASRDEPV